MKARLTLRTRGVPHSYGEVYVEPPPYEPETTAFLTAISVPNDATVYFSSTAYEITGSEIWEALDTCVVSVKNAMGLSLKVTSLSDEFIYWYPRIGGTATAHKYNLVDATDFGIFSGGFTHDGSGADPNGTNGVFDTEHLLNEFNLNDLSFFAWIKENNAGDYADWGCVAGGGVGELLMYPRRADNTLRSRLSSGLGDLTDSNSNSSGLIGHSRIVSTEFKSYRNGAVIETNSDNSFALNTLKIQEFATGYLTDGSYLFYTPNKHTHFIGMNGVTPTQAADIYTALSTLETTLNR